MVSNFKKSSVAITMAFLFVSAFSCGDDKMTLRSEPDPIGIYNAYFYFTRDYGTGTAITVKAKLNWNFLSDIDFNYAVDNEDPFTDPDNDICDVSSGEYSRTTVNDITFSNVVPGVRNCDVATSINGTFSTNVVADTFRMEQEITDRDLYILIKLVPAY